MCRNGPASLGQPQNKRTDRRSAHAKSWATSKPTNKNCLPQTRETILKRASATKPKIHNFDEISEYGRSTLSTGKRWQRRRHLLRNKQLIFHCNRNKADICAKGKASHMFAVRKQIQLPIFSPKFLRRRLISQWRIQTTTIYPLICNEQILFRKWNLSNLLLFLNLPFQPLIPGCWAV